MLPEEGGKRRNFRRCSALDLPSPVHRATRQTCARHRQAAKALSTRPRMQAATLTETVPGYEVHLRGPLGSDRPSPELQRLSATASSRCLICAWTDLPELH